MARVVVEPGVCGFTCRIEAVMMPNGLVAVTIESDCELVREFAESFDAIDPVHQLYAADGDNPLHCHRCHHGCLVPIGVIKAVEAEAGLALPRDAEIRFVRQR